MNRRRTLKNEAGALTLLVAIGLVILASLASFYSARSVLMDQMATDNHARASQARWAAEAALASAQAAFLTPGADLQGLFSSLSACPPGITGPQWQCTLMNLSPHPALPQAQLSATAVRDLVMTPHVVTLYAKASLVGQHSQAQTRESLFAPVLAAAPGLSAPAALVVNGCISQAADASLRVCPLNGKDMACTGTAKGASVQTHFVVDTNANGSISSAEKNACLALTSASLPAGGSKTGPATATPRTPCARAAWRSVLGDISDEQLKAWSEAQERNGLTAQSTPPRTVYWSDSPNDWEQTIGTAQNPALLVFSALACALRCPHIGANVKIFGSVLIASSCNDEKMRGWQAGLIEGQLVVESGMPEWRLGAVYARPEGRNAYILDWPEGINASQVQRVNGSRSEGTSP
jgi:hypothetical protein